MEKQNKYTTWIKRILLVVLAYLSVLSIAKIVSLNGDPNVYYGGNYFGYNLSAIALFGITVWLLRRFVSRLGDKRLVWTSVCGGLFLSTAIVYGAYAHLVNDIFISAKESLLQIGCILGVAFLTVPLTRELLLQTERASSWMQQKKPKERAKLKGVFLTAWLFIFVCYIPLFLSQWPGNFIFDAKYQMGNALTDHYTTHHPLIHTLMMAIPYQWGSTWGNVSAGFQIYTLAQMLILSSAFAYAVWYLWKKKVPKCICVVVLLWFAWFPMHALFSITATKDVLCSAFVLYFFIYLLRLFWDKEQFGVWSYVGLIVTGTLACLFRNNVVYVAVATGMVLFLVVKGMKSKVTTIALFVVIYILTSLINTGLLTATNAIEAGRWKETMSVPLQCLARVAAYRGDELSTEEYEQILVFIREEDIANYNPYLSDPIKDNAYEVNIKNQFGDYIKLLVKLGLKYPDEYIESIVSNTMGFWYPLNQGVYVSGDIALYHTLIGYGEEIEKKNYCEWAGNLYNSFFVYKEYQYVPVVGYLFRNAIYIWAMIYFIIWCIYRKEYTKLFAAGVFPFLYFGTCLLGPMAALRYVYPIIVCIPVMMIVMLLKAKKEE